MLEGTWAQCWKLLLRNSLLDDPSILCPIPASVQGQVGWSPGQPNLVVGSLTHGRGWILVTFKIHSNPTHSMTLWFYNHRELNTGSPSSVGFFPIYIYIFCMYCWHRSPLSVLKINTESLKSDQKSAGGQMYLWDQPRESLPCLSHWFWFKSIDQMNHWWAFGNMGCQVLLVLRALSTIDLLVKGGFCFYGEDPQFTPRFAINCITLEASHPLWASPYTVTVCLPSLRKLEKWS